MINQKYKDQVALLIRLLPMIALNGRFALHGGTAINLFVQDMPRLSVDIDLTYIEMSHRVSALIDIRKGLQILKATITRDIPGVQIVGPEEDGIETKLFCRVQGVQVKIEVNTIMRGLISEAEIKSLGQTAAKEFDSFCEVSIVPYAQLYGGKICAALDRQHPRDIFDVKLFLQDENNLNKIKPGLMYALLSSNRPLHELLAPRFSNQEHAFYNQFYGMSRLPFSYTEFEDTRKNLLEVIKPLFSDKDKIFLLAYAKGEPNWEEYDFRAFPSVQWKLHNLEKFKLNAPDSFQGQLTMLTEILDRW